MESLHGSYRLLVVEAVPEGDLVLLLVAGDGEAGTADPRGAVPQHVGVPGRDR